MPRAHLFVAAELLGMASMHAYVLLPLFLADLFGMKLAV